MRGFKQGVPVIAGILAISVLSFFLGSMTSSGVPLRRHDPHLRPLPLACTVIADIDASGNDAHAGGR